MSRRFVSSFVESGTKRLRRPYDTSRMDVVALGKGIRERRLAQNLGIEALVKDAARRGIDAPAISYISRLERGISVRPGAIELEALAAALQVGSYKDFEGIGRGDLDARTLQPKQQTDQEFVLDLTAVAERLAGPASPPKTSAHAPGKPPADGQKPTDGQTAPAQSSKPKKPAR